jgi:tetratricopeptide (TPR) repeat protein
MSKWWAKDRGYATKNADKAIELFQAVLDFDDELAKKQKIAPLRVSASLTPDAHAGMAHCYIIKADSEDVESLDKAVVHIQIFSKTAEKARRFWTMRRQKIIAEDPLREGQRGDADPTTVRGQERQRYEIRILKTIEQEIAMRRTLVEVYNRLKRYADSISECDIILQLDKSYDEIYWLRGQALASLKPPDYKAALEDIEEYHKRKSAGGLTEELVRVNRWIKKYRTLLARQQKKNAGS